MAADANTLLDLAKCYLCQTPREWQLLKLGLLKQIVLTQNPVADTSVNTLLDQVKCYACLPPGFWPLLELALLQQVIVSVSGGAVVGGGSIFRGTGNPNGVVTSTTTAALYYDQATGKWWQFDGIAGANTGWDEIL